MANKTKSIKGTQTEKNLAISYMNEAQAYARYTFYAQQADKENYFPIGEIFRDTASNELRHGKIFLKMLEGGTVDIALTPDAGVTGDTATNLEIAEIEQHHCDRFERYLQQVKDGTVWKRDKPIKWKCLVCGYIYEGKQPPAVCPACDHPREHYMALD